ncbi:MAG TPA: hypothetical protein VMW52_03815, partial [Phycisphaerae bacterium]|nr:hypothetical protein [Phycisphaerae bacterium]
TRLVRAVTAEVRLTQTEIKGRNIHLRTASFRSPWARLWIHGRRIPILQFNARQTRKGVTYALRRHGGRTLIPHAFLATMPTGHRGVFARTEPKFGYQPGGLMLVGGRRASGVRKHGLPIVEQYGPSVPAVVEKLPEFAAGVFHDAIADKLQAEIDSQVGLLIERHRPAAAAGG